MSTHIFTYDQSFELESGERLPRYQLAYTTLGQLNNAGGNIVWVFHALTANSNPAEWWPGMVGQGRFFDPDKYFIVCVNMPGSCYGSTGPLDENPLTKEPYYHDFPFFTTRDLIRAYQPLKDFLGISRIHIGIGGSMGGQQLLEWAIEEPGLFEYIVPIATNGVHSPWGVAFNASQRMCIEADSSWKNKDPQAGMQGMKVARSLALLSYRNYETYASTQPRDKKAPFPVKNPYGGEAAESYQRYQGEKLGRRFNAFSYYKLSQGMDSHDVGRNRPSVEAALKTISARTVAIGISSDILFPATEQEFIASHVPGAVFKEIDSLYGHDGFLLEYEAISDILKEYIGQKSSGNYLKVVNE